MPFDAFIAEEDVLVQQMNFWDRSGFEIFKIVALHPRNGRERFLVVLREIPVGRIEERSLTPPDSPGGSAS